MLSVFVWPNNCLFFYSFQVSFVILATSMWTQKRSKNHHHSKGS